ncbi:ABC transporter substrate-binding protein [Novosphingobium fuchskuhlense]|uniref:ABC transporter substrate-binding protein n=1 Tax=Novosphingobium fuchskuhlense TaxID=1117702 RepID=A0A117UXF1_9SPHN|nr:ABC transporter substrate-binding protein [Novosphingobium fuchskuhlense]KUR72613.1 ABC transporter substrate-binding protein [Novosphingobium fuchskuhlense]
MVRASRLSVAATLALAGLGALLLGVSACGRRSGGPLPIALIGDRTALDVGCVRLSPAARTLRGATVEGLVAFDAEGHIVPALADRWIITDDGQSYIFRLREGTWPGGSRITGETAAAVLRTALAQLKGTPLGLDLAAIAQIRVMADRVIEIDLAGPVPDLLTLLAQPELGLPYARRGAGPMALGRRGASTELTMIPPEKRGLVPEEGFSGHVRPLVVDLLPAAKAVQRFNDGTADLVLGGRVDSFPLAQEAALARGNVQLDPVIGLFGLLVETENGFLAEAPNREALALAIDRDAIIAAFNIGGWQPTTRIVSAGVEGDAGTVGERWVGVAPEQRRALAAERVTRYMASGKPAPLLRIAAPGGPGTRRVIDRLATDFKAIGIVVVQVGEDTPADLRLLDATARYGRASWFLNQLACSVHKPACNIAGDQLLAQARQTADLRERARLLGEAEAEITAANPYIPIARPLRWSLVRAGVTGFAPNPWGWHPLPPMALLPK